MSPMSHQISPAVASHDTRRRRCPGFPSPGRDALPRVRSVRPVPVAQERDPPDIRADVAQDSLLSVLSRSRRSATLPYAQHFQFAIGHPTLPRIAQKQTTAHSYLSNSLVPFKDVNLPLIRPIVSIGDKSLADRIVANIFPFMRIALTRTQLPIPAVALEQGRISRGRDAIHCVRSRFTREGRAPARPFCPSWFGRAGARPSRMHGTFCSQLAILPRGRHAIHCVRSRFAHAIYRVRSRFAQEGRAPARPSCPSCLGRAGARPSRHAPISLC